MYSLGFSQRTANIERVLTSEAPDSTEIDSAYAEPVERITDFNVEINIAKNADVTVTETIKVFANGNLIQRGIFRTLPTIRNINGRVEDVTYHIVSVKKNGAKEPYKIKKEPRMLTLYIGDADIYLNSGDYTYEITYKTSDQIGYFDGYDEFYWNVNGTDWDFPVEHIQATVFLPNGATILQNSCYTGSHGSKDTNCYSKKLSTTSMEFNASDLLSNENLTFAVGFKPQIIDKPSIFAKWIKKNWPSFLLVLVSLYLLYFYYTNWLKYGKDPAKPTVIPQFNPPNDLSPGALGFIDKGEFNVSQVSANLVDLHIKGFIDIDENENPKDKLNVFRTFDIKSLKKSDDSLQKDQQILLDNFFEKKDHIEIKGTYNAGIKKAVTKYRDFLENKLKLYVDDFANNKLIYKAIKIIVITFLGSLLISSVYHWKGDAIFMGGILLLFDSLFLAIYVFLWRTNSKGLFFGFLFFTIWFFVPFFAIAFFPMEQFTSFESDAFKFVIFGGITLLIFQYLINKPSEEKVNMKAEIEGFKMYLGTAEENQLQFHNPPEMTTDLYEKFLPYAIVFGVDGIWGKKFRKSLSDTIEAMPEYANMMAFGASFNDSFTNSLSASTVAPVSSYSSSSSGSSSSSSRSSSSSYSGGSSSSGSSGGGSSGGGGGGGGGGGW